MKTIEESVVNSMDGSDCSLFPFLPYILRDIWEIGTLPEVFITLVGKHAKNFHQLKVLDLGCGKGAVSIKLAEKYGCTCHGIDGISEFIEEAKNKAVSYGVDNLCQFTVGDIRTEINAMRNFDIIIFGAIGPVLGDYYNTLTIAKQAINANGLIIIDDGYVEDNSSYTNPSVASKSEILKHITDAGMSLIDEIIIEPNDVNSESEKIFINLKKRCNELIEKHPDKKQLFLDYIKNQEIENEILGNKVICSTMVVKNNSPIIP